jgi:hypothetical protein
MKNMPIFRYNFRNPIIDPMNLNYKFSRRLEMSVFGREAIRDYIVENFRPEKAQMMDEDLGTPETQANIAFYTYRGVEMYKLTTRERDMKQLKPSPFQNVLKGIVAKHQKLLRDEIKEWEAQQKAAEKEARKGAQD